jgi:hypothetical protein
VQRLSANDVGAELRSAGVDEHALATHPTNSCAVLQNDYTKLPTGLWNGAVAGINVAAVLEEEKRIERDLTFAERKQLTAALQQD